jgi:hypothetical protein
VHGPAVWTLSLDLMTVAAIDRHRTGKSGPEKAEQASAMGAGRLGLHTSSGVVDQSRSVGGIGTGIA